ncbi:MAG: serine/threonine protein kinase [Myxococcaceae bacterium]
MGLFICQGCGSEQTSWDGKCVKCGTTEIIKLAQKTDKMVEKVVDGRYKIIRKLGQGGMGAVYLAESLGIGQRVALKFLKADLSEDAEIAKRFMTEAKSYALVAHPNAVTLHDFRQDPEGNLYISMEYCEGIDLKKVLADQRRMSVADAVEVALQTADVLGYAHTKGVIHRDLKPENIMIRKGMRGIHVKVLDFGIARLVNASTQLTVQGSIAGTPRYMAPEQVEGKPIDHRIDVYSLGVLLFELLTGVQPFDGQTIAEILRAQVVNPMPHLSDIDSDLDFPEIDAVIQRATAKSREDRFPDMSRFASALSMALPTAANMPALKVTGAGEPDLGGTFIRPQATPAPEALTRSATLPDPPVPDEPRERSRPSPPGPGLESEPTQLAPVRSSRGALYAVVGVLALVTAGVAVVKLTVPDPPSPIATVVPPVVPPVEPVPPLPAVPPVAVTADPSIAHLRAVDFMARADAAFKAGDFETARVYLGEVPEDPEYRPRADQLGAVIAGLEKKLAQARGQAARGDCSSAIQAYDEILKVNANVRAASLGRSQCKQALPPSTFE